MTGKTNSQWTPDRGSIGYFSVLPRRYLCLKNQ
jgi:hypothetical protein